MSREEVRQLIAHAHNLKHRTMLMTTYAGGLRLSEVLHLRVGDIDSARMTIRVEQGKGGKDRYTVLSGHLLAALRGYWKIYHPATWLFPSSRRPHPMDPSGLQRADQTAKRRAGITKPGGIHALRHYAFATHLLEAGVDVMAPLLWCALGDAALAQTAAHVAVIINEADEASVRVGEYYAVRRAIPSANVIRIRAASTDAIDRAAYVAAIERPIAAALGRGQLQDLVHYLVITKGVPLRITGTPGQEGTGASVDSELTLLYRQMVGETVLTRGRVDNPYFLGVRDIAEARPFTHRDYDIFLVSRLDAFTADEAMALVDRAMAPASAGRIVLDQRGVPAAHVGDGWLAAAQSRLTTKEEGVGVVLESTAEAARDVTPVVGYYSWGSSDPANLVRSRRMGFVPGTFREPPADWTPGGDAPGRAAWFEGSAHGLVGDLIREGVTGVAGHVSEPYLHSVVRPEILFPAYLAGRNLVESFYLALPHLGWQTVVGGDPLCAPFPPQEAELMPAAPPLFAVAGDARVDLDEPAP